LTGKPGNANLLAWPVRQRKSSKTMKHTNKFPKCGSSDVIADAKAIDRADNGALSVATFRKPDAVMLKGQLTTTLAAWVCADCDYLSFMPMTQKASKSRPPNHALEIRTTEDVSRRDTANLAIGEQNHRH
jgi:hypothetical protein